MELESQSNAANRDDRDIRLKVFNQPLWSFLSHKIGKFTYVYLHIYICKYMHICLHIYNLCVYILINASLLLPSSWWPLLRTCSGSQGFSLFKVLGGLLAGNQEFRTYSYETIILLNSGKKENLYWFPSESKIYSITFRIHQLMSRSKFKDMKI